MRKLALAVAAVLAFAAGSANAGLIHWNIASVSSNFPYPAGSFVYDTTNQAFSQVSITGVTGLHYTSATGGANFFTATTPGSLLSFAGFPSLALEGVFLMAGQESVWSGSQPGQYKFAGAGVAKAAPVSVPEPGTLWLVLFGCGLLALASWSRSRTTVRGAVVGA